MKTNLAICMLIDLPDKTYTKDLGSANRSNIPTYLSNFGHSVTWLISSESAETLQQIYSDDKRVFIIPYTSIVKTSSLLAEITNKLLNSSRRMLAILKIYRNNHFDLIYVKGDILDGLIALYIRQRYKIPLVLDPEPPWMLWEVYKMKSKWPKPLLYLITKLYCSAMMCVIKKADLVTPCSRWFGDALCRRGVPRNKIFPYPNGVNLSTFSNQNDQSIQELYNLSDSTVIIYIGTLDKARSLNVLLEAFAKVKSQGKKVKLLMVGDGSDSNNLRELALNLNIHSDVVFTGQVPNSEVSKFIAAADIGMSPVPPLNCYKISSPIKLLEYLGEAKPAIANDEIFDQREVLEQSGAGILVSFNSDSFANAMIELVDNPAMTHEMGQKGKIWVSDNRSYQILAKQVEKRYLEIADS